MQSVLDAERAACDRPVVMREIDADLPAVTVQTIDDLREGGTQQSRFGLSLIGLFAGLAVMLASIGLYGVLAYSTEQRTREIGVRLALGSQRSAVILLVVREMALIAGIAVVVALPSVVGLAQLFRSQLYGVTTFDPITLGGAVFLTTVMVVAAAALPARRAAAVQPMQALRNE